MKRFERDFKGKLLQKFSLKPQSGELSGTGLMQKCVGGGIITEMKAGV
jgi:hypothetical protein